MISVNKKKKKILYVCKLSKALKISAPKNRSKEKFKKKKIELDENRNITYQNVSDTF